MRNRRIVLVLCAVAALAVLWLRVSRQNEAAAPAPAPVVAVAPPPAEIPALPSNPRIESGGTLTIDSRALEPGKPLVVKLVLGEPSRSDEALAVRMLSEHDGVHEGAGALSSERTDVSFAINPAWLHPGRYIVEVKTTEQTHFPLRRYVIEVR